MASEPGDLEWADDWCIRCYVLKCVTEARAVLASPEAAAAEPREDEKHECQRCGSDEWTWSDYRGCDVCRPADVNTASAALPAVDAPPEPTT